MNELSEGARVSHKATPHISGTIVRCIGMQDPRVFSEPHKLYRVIWDGSDKSDTVWSDMIEESK